MYKHLINITFFFLLHAKVKINLFVVDVVVVGRLCSKLVDSNYACNLFLAFFFTTN